MKQVVYIKSKHGQNNNYVSAVGRNGSIGFTRDISLAITLEGEQAVALREFLEQVFGEAHIEDSPKGESE